MTGLNKKLTTMSHDEVSDGPYADAATYLKVLCAMALVDDVKRISFWSLCEYLTKVKNTLWGRISVCLNKGASETDF